MSDLEKRVEALCAEWEKEYGVGSKHHPADREWALDVVRRLRALLAAPREEPGLREAVKALRDHYSVLAADGGQSEREQGIYANIVARLKALAARPVEEWPPKDWGLTGPGGLKPVLVPVEAKAETGLLGEALDFMQAIIDLHVFRDSSELRAEFDALASRMRDAIARPAPAVRDKIYELLDEAAQSFHQEQGHDYECGYRDAALSLRNSIEGVFNAALRSGAKEGT